MSNGPHGGDLYARIRAEVDLDARFDQLRSESMRRADQASAKATHAQLTKYLLTADGRCPECRVEITGYESELGHEALIDGIVRPVSVTYVLQPCGHPLTKALI